jgi:AbrB family looped-hinge helix DNA binding protein
MAVQKLSSKNQIVLPKEARQAMGVKGGDELLVVVKKDLTIVMPKPRSYARILRGLAKGTLLIFLNENASRGKKSAYRGSAL